MSCPQPMKPSSLSDRQEDTYVHENVFCVAVRVGIPEALWGHPGWTRQKSKSVREVHGLLQSSVYIVYLTVL